VDKESTDLRTYKKGSVTSISFYDYWLFHTANIIGLKYVKTCDNRRLKQYGRKLTESSRLSLVSS